MQPIAEAINALAGQLAQFMQVVTHQEHARHELMGKLDEQGRRYVELASREYPVPQVTVRGAKREYMGYDVVLVRDEEDNEILGFRLRPVGAGD